MQGIQLLGAFLSDESGATAIEYGLNTLGTTMSNKFTSINSSLK